MLKLPAIVCCVLIVSVECDRPASHREPKTYKLIQELVRNNFERSLRLKHHQLQNRASSWLNAVRQSRYLRKRPRKIDSFKSKSKFHLEKVKNGVDERKSENITHSPNQIDRTFKIPQLFQQDTRKPSIDSNPSFVIKPAGI